MAENQLEAALGLAKQIFGGQKCKGENNQDLLELMDEDVLWIVPGGTSRVKPSEKFIEALKEYSISSAEVKKISDGCYMVCGELTGESGSMAFSVIFGSTGARTQLTEADPKIHLAQNTTMLLAKSIHLSYIHSQEERTDIKEQLRLSEKRYEIAIQASGITMFEYDLRTGEFLFYQDVADMYNLPRVVPDGVNTFVFMGIVEPGSVQEYRDMYRRIHRGEPFASCYVKTRDKNGDTHDYELLLTNVFDKDGCPVRAIGVRRNVSQYLNLQREWAFGKNFASDRILVLEADVATGLIEFLNSDWISEFGGGELCLDDAVLKMVQGHVAPEHQEAFLEMLSSRHIESVYSEGDNLVSLDFRRCLPGGCYAWYEATANIIRNAVTQSLYLRLYLRNIDTNKRKQKRANEEQRLYEALIADAMLLYEFNLSTGRISKERKGFGKKYGTELTEDYSESLHRLAEKWIHSEDQLSFCSVFDRDRVMRSFNKGERLIVHEYRRCTDKGEYLWVRCSFHLFEDPETEEVRGYAYVQDIHEEKSKEISLKYNAEHDIMTGFFNKTTAEERIRAYLNSSEGQFGRHAFYIIDIDYFKYVNDTFGHLFGDKVIREMADSIRSIFRESDIMGRLGGDEFCVFMRNVESWGIIENRAKELCERISRSYIRGGKSSSVSASVGVAVYAEHGHSFSELFEHADRALYIAKEKGRNRYELTT